MANFSWFLAILLIVVVIQVIEGNIAIANQAGQVEYLSKRQFNRKVRNGEVSQVWVEIGQHQRWLPINEWLTLQNGNRANVQINGPFTANPEAHTVCAPVMVRIEPPAPAPSPSHIVVHLQHPAPAPEPPPIAGWTVAGQSCLYPATLPSGVFPPPPPAPAPPVFFCNPNGITGQLTFAPPAPAPAPIDWNDLQTEYDHYVQSIYCTGSYDPNADHEA